MKLPFSFFVFLAVFLMGILTGFGTETLHHRHNRKLLPRVRRDGSRVFLNLPSRQRFIESVGSPPSPPILLNMFGTTTAPPTETTDDLNVEHKLQRLVGARRDGGNGGMGDGGMYYAYAGYSSIVSSLIGAIIQKQQQAQALAAVQAQQQQQVQQYNGFASQTVPPPVRPQARPTNAAVKPPAVKTYPSSLIAMILSMLSAPYQPRSRYGYGNED